MLVTVDIPLNEIKHSVAMHMLVLRNRIPKSEMNRANRIGWRLIDSDSDADSEFGIFGFVYLIECEILRNPEPE